MVPILHTGFLTVFRRIMVNKAVLFLCLILVLVHLVFEIEITTNTEKIINEQPNHITSFVNQSNITKNVLEHVQIAEGDHGHNSKSLGNSSLLFQNHIDRIYYINLDNRTDKKEFMESWLEPFSKEHSIPYQRISALSGDDACKNIKRGVKQCLAKLGLRNSNLNIMDNYNTTGYTLVLEDDVQIKSYERLLNGINKVPDDWDVIRFDCWRGGEGFLDPLEEFPQFEGGFRTITPRGEKPFCGGTHIALWRNDRLPNLRKIWKHSKYMDIDCALADDEIKSYCVQAKILLKRYFKTDIPKRI